MTPKIVVQPAIRPPMSDDSLSKYHRFGWANLRFNGILSQPLTAYVVLCTCTFIQNFSVNGANNAVISTLERVFYLDSVQSGLFLSLYDLATVFSSPLVGYLGSRYSSPIFFSLNMIIVGIGNMLIASSNFVNHDTTLNFNPEVIQYLSSNSSVLFQCSKDPLNGKNITDISCVKQERLSNSIHYAKFVLYLGNFVNGIGSVALFTIGIAYIERIFPREKAAYCQGIYFAVGTVGGALGIVATGQFLQLYTRFVPKKRLPSWLTPSNPLWIGCWWLPYIIYGGLCLVIGLFVSGLPNFEKPGTKHPVGPTTSINGQANPNNLGIIREDSPTSVTVVSSRPPTPISMEDMPESKADPDMKSENTFTMLKTPTNEYRLSHRKFRQLSPISSQTKEDTLTVKNSHPIDGTINHAYSIESIYNNSTSNELPDVSSSKASDSTPTPPPSITTTTLPSSRILQRSMCENLRNMFAIVIELMKNTRYVFIIIANLVEGILIKGFVPFITKYFEYQHQLNSSTATLVTGAIALVSVVIGCPMGAYCINRFSWTPMHCARVCSIVFTISSFLFLFLILSCPELKFSYTSCTTANTACCRSIYHPVCQVDQPAEMFLSPCHFGCTIQRYFETNNTFLYSSCNCAENATITLSESACRFHPIPCPLIFALTMIGATFVVFFTAFIQVPMLQVLLYSVPLAYQSMGLGLRQTIVRVLGQTTGPLLFGFAFDESCLVWLIDCFGRRTCTVYNNRRMGLSMALSGFSTRMISGISCGVVFLHWKFRNSNDVVVTSSH